MMWLIVISIAARVFNILCTTLELEWVHVHSLREVQLSP
jgi:hypothetical protein